MNKDLPGLMARWLAPKPDESGPLAEMAANALELTPANEGKRWQATDDGDQIYSYRVVGAVWDYYLESGTDSFGNISTEIGTALAGEENANSSTTSRVRIKNSCNFTRIDLSAGTPVDVSGGVPARLCGLYVDVVLSAHAVTVEEDGGDVIATIPASTAIGAFDIGLNGHAARCESSLTVTPNASSTGILVVYWEVI